MDQGPGSYIPEEDVSVTSTKLGSGGQGQVYKAVYSGREVALKLAGQTNAEITQRQARDAARELRTLQALRHDCVVEVSLAGVRLADEHLQLELSS